MTELPSYADLPPAPHGGRSAWGLFGPDDNLGLVNLMTPERIAAAARLVRRGQLFCLDLPLGSISPALAAFRGTPRHHVLHPPGTAGFDDVYDNFYPQAGSQWDSLAHVGYAPDQMYNGATEQEILAGTQEHHRALGPARDGGPRGPPGRRARAAGRRAALRTRASAHRSASRTWNWPGVRPASSSRRGTSSCCTPASPPGTSSSPAEVKARLHGNVAAPGVAHTEAMCEYLWNSHAAAIASDTFAVESFPADRGAQAHPFGFLHNMLIGQLGMALGELWWLADLADDCAADGVYEMFLVSAPMNAPGGIGSPANAVAIK